MKLMYWILIGSMVFFTGTLIYFQYTINTIVEGLK